MIKLFAKKKDHALLDEMLYVLKETLRLAKISEDSIWSDMDVEEISGMLSKAVEKIEAGKSPSMFKLKYLFAPTGPIQETSMENGWSDLYLELSERFDEAAEKWG
ncbi:hypothetical protein ACJJIR_12630 [Microbulbifer sp. SSSA008]|uniref:hypothetical protein n=1 Tax=Microbulbifer sp. SSSA008 TaxID=3243380 RepID=UPI0040399432